MGERRNFDEADESRTFSNGRIDVVKLGTTTAGRYTFEPGWRWSNDVKPIASTDSCENDHVGYVLSGTLHVDFDDGTEIDARPGEAYHIPPGHDAWVEGDEPFVGLEFKSEAAEAYAKE